MKKCTRRKLIGTISPVKSSWLTHGAIGKKSKKKKKSRAIDDLIAGLRGEDEEVKLEDILGDIEEFGKKFGKTEAKPNMKLDVSNIVTRVSGLEDYLLKFAERHDLSKKQRGLLVGTLREFEQKMNGVLNSIAG